MRFWGVGGLMLVCLVGCGSSPDGSNTAVQSVVTAVDTSTTSTGPPPSSEPVAVPMSYDVVNDAIPVIQFDSEPTDVPAPYFGSQNASGGAAEALDGFVPTSDDQEFCWAVEAINSRPQPRDDFHQVVVADGYFSAIRPFAIAAVAGELDVLIGFTSTIVLQGSYTEADEVDNGPIATAIESINAIVDERCLGIAPTTD